MLLGMVFFGRGGAVCVSICSFLVSFVLEALLLVLVAICERCCLLFL